MLTTEFGLTTDGRGRISTVSQELCELLAVDEDALVGQRVSALVHPDDRVETERRQIHPFDGRLLKVRLRRRDGRHTWMSATTSSPDFPAAQTVQWAFVDVSEQVQFERRLVEMASGWADVFNVLREGVIVIDRDGITLSANAAAADFLGTDLKDLAGSLARAQVVVVDENGLPMPRERLPSTRAFATGRAQEEQLAYRRRDGTTRWLQARVVPLTHPTENEPDRVVILLDDAVGPSHEQPRGAVQAAALTALTRRELDVLGLLAQGHDVTSAATNLNISVHTARGHLKQLMKKLDARSQLQAVVFAARAGLIRVEYPPANGGRPTPGGPNWALEHTGPASEAQTMWINEEADAAVMRLIADYNDRIAAGSILRCLASSVHELRAAGVKAGIITTAETMTRQRLESRLRESSSVA